MYAARRRQKSVRGNFQFGKLCIGQPFQFFDDLFGQLRYLTPGQAPKAVFELGSEKPVAVYAYCNLHGLWMTKL